MQKFFTIFAKPCFLFAKVGKSVIILDMKRTVETKTNNQLLPKLLGEPNSAKTSGLAYTLAVIIPAILSFLFLIAVGISGASEQEGYDKQDWYLYATFLIPQIAFALVALVVARYENAGIKSAIISQKCEPKYFVWAIVLQIGLLALAELNTLFLSFLEQFGYQDPGLTLPSMDGIGFFGVLLTVAVLPAVFEELMFRGLLLKGLRAFGTLGATLICGGLFSLYHQNPAQTIYQFCCGAAYALMAIRAGSVLPTMLAHFLNNAFILVLSKFGVTSFSPPVAITLLIVSAVCFLGALVYLIFFDKKSPAPLLQTEKKSAVKTFFFFAATGIVLCLITWLGVLLMGM